MRAGARRGRAAEAGIVRRRARRRRGRSRSRGRLRARPAASQAAEVGARGGGAAPHGDRQGPAVQAARNPGARAVRQVVKSRLFEDSMAHAIPLWTPPALPISGSGDTFPVRRIFCVGRNYAEHQKEMGGDGRETPFFFLKTEFALMPRGGDVHYPAKSANYHYETELVVALAKGGRRIDAKKANDHIFGYAVG